MKIAYLLEVDPYKNSGVVKKINDQVSYWKNQGREVVVFNIWPKSSVHTTLFLNAIHYHNNIIDKLAPRGFIRTYITKASCSSRVKKAIEAYNPDILYLRQNIWYPGVLDIISNNISVLEINTVDSLEMDYYGGLKKKVYFYGRNKILEAANGVIAVTPSILEHYSLTNIPSTVVSNGINFKNIEFKKKKYPSNKSNLIFVGSNNMKWHGLPTIFKLAALLPDDDFYIVGYSKEDFPHIQLKNIIFKGWMEKPELALLYQNMHFGLGSFGNYLVGKSIDSTLKVREYLAYGLPVLLGHHDVDFMNCDFVKKATNEANNIIDIEEIKTFLSNNREVVVEQNQIEIISSETKENERLRFFKKIIKENRKN